MAQLPEGVVTLLLTDIEGSTSLWREHPRSMAGAVERHDEILTAAIESAGGIVIKDKLEGDSFFAVFDLASEAIAAACAIQRGLAEEPWPGGIRLRVRMALHTGEVQLREGDYFGHPVNQCARLRSVAHGGQVLVSATTKDLVIDSLPESFVVRPLGLHRLRDLGRPLDVFQLTCPDMQRDFPALKSLDAFPNNLPVQLTAFVGREEESAEVTRLLRTHRLTTLTGLGGCGKTRLALHVAAESLEQYPDGAWLLDLAPTSDPALLSSELAQVLAVSDVPGTDLEDALCEHLKEHRALLVFDNCEHLIEPCAQLAHRILAHCRGVQMLATSREPLNVPGEAVWSVPPLGLPRPGDASEPEDALSYGAIQLFIDRAKRRDPRFELDDGNVGSIAQLCRKLEGIPLAIELAAALIGTMSISEMAKRIERRLELLTRGPRTAPPRHRSLRATIDWSYELLTEHEQSLFRCLSAYMGFDLAAAEATWQAVSADRREGTPARPRATELVSCLVDKSLLVMDGTATGASRYRMLETIREYGRERLLAAGEEAAVRNRHVDYYMSLAAQSEPELYGPSETECLDKLELEHDNIRAALSWAVETGKTDTALHAIETLTRFWCVRGHIAEGRRRLEDILAVPTPDPVTIERTRALKCAGTLAYYRADLDAAQQRYEESLALWSAADDQRGIAMLLNNLGNVARQRGDLRRARELYEESLAIKRELGASRLVALTLDNLAQLADDQGDYEYARACAEESLAIEEDLGNVEGTAWPCLTLGIVALHAGRPREAQNYLQRGLAVFMAQKSEAGIARAKRYLGILARLNGDYETARMLLAGSLLGLEEELRGDRAHTLDALGDVLLAQQDLEGASELFSESLAIRLRLKDGHGILQSLYRFAGLASEVGDAVRALRLAGAADALRQAWGTAASLFELSQHSVHISEARDQLGMAAADAAIREGSRLDLTQAARYALDRHSWRRSSKS